MSESEVVLSIKEPDAPKPTRPTFREFNKSIYSQYTFECDEHSTMCDVIAMYLMGQKILYTEAKTYCEQHLNYLMLPAIFITAACSIISLVLKDSFGPVLVSSLNGFNAFLLAVVNYMKLDSKAEAHKTSAYKFDVLQSNLVFNSGKLLFMSDNPERLREIIVEVEKGVQEIKQSNQFILPEHIRRTYPKLYLINIFAEVKKINIKEIQIINRLRNLYVDINEGADKEQLYREGVAEYIELKNKYLEIDRQFDDEIKDAFRVQRRSWNPCNWLKT